ncbi:hypothetical protein [Variovorax sp. dw_954]|uniref:hypothetical protein n=1 Tax=Variovorax sp. dw_954 TaxID=2720078 RepID=UPI001BD2E49C|nr:hypothetical protein [Variovorax sp. dw_954]
MLSSKCVGRAVPDFSNRSGRPSSRYWITPAASHTSSRLAASAGWSCVENVRGLAPLRAAMLSPMAAMDGTSTTCQARSSGIAMWRR